jgi:uncharacterized protein (DUF433 family)
MPPIRQEDSKIRALYGGDVREIPAYNILQASRYLKIPRETLRRWVRGQAFPSSKNSYVFKPVIQLPDQDRPLLSFVNLIEAHVLDGMRRHHSVPFPKIREGLAYLNENYPSKHPLADRLFRTNGIDLFIDDLDQFIKISGKGQIVMRHIVEAFLHRIDRSIEGTPIQIFPFLRKPERIGNREVDRLEQQPRSVVINPLISFGRPILSGTGVPTDVVADRFNAGEDINELAEDYGITLSQVQEALRYESPAREAA